MEVTSLERLCVRLHVIGLDSKCFLYLVDSLNTRHSVGIQLVGHPVCLLALLEEAGVFGFLTTLGLVDNVFQDRGLFLQVSLNIITLRRSYIANRLLLRVEHVNLLLAEGSFLGQLQNVFLNLVESGLETARKSGANRVARLHHDGSGGAHN